MTPRELGEWLEYLAGDEGKDGLFAMLLVAHFDESVSQKPRDVYAVGGYLATAKQWPKFSRRWTATLERYGIDPPVFHMTDFENKQERFALRFLPDEKRLPLQTELIGLIRKYALVGVANAFPAIEFDRMCEEYVPRGAYQSPYSEIAAEIREPATWCLLTCIRRLEQYRAQHRIKGKIACVFDWNQDTESKISRFYERMIASESILKAFLPGITFSSRQKAVPLQAADVIAYEAMKHIRNRVIGPTTRPVRKSFAALHKEDLKLYGRYYDPAQLRYFFRDASLRAAALDVGMTTRLSPRESPNEAAPVASTPSPSPIAGSADNQRSIARSRARADRMG